MCTVRKVFLKISRNSQENTCARVSFLIKFIDLKPTMLLKKRLWHRCFPSSFAKFLRTPFLQKSTGCCFCRKRLQQRCSTVNLAKILKNLFSRTPPSDCFRGLQNQRSRQAQTSQQSYYYFGVFITKYGHIFVYST